MPLVMLIDIQGVVPENIHTPSTEGLEIHEGGGVVGEFSKAQNFK